MWGVLHVTSDEYNSQIGPGDIYKFQKVILIGLIVGLIASIIFHVVVKESANGDANGNGTQLIECFNFVTYILFDSCREFSRSYNNIEIFR